MVRACFLPNFRHAGRQTDGTTTYHCDQYEDAEENGQADVVPRQLPLRCRSCVRTVRYIGRHPASVAAKHGGQFADR